MLHGKGLKFDRSALGENNGLITGAMGAAGCDLIFLVFAILFVLVRWRGLVGLAGLVVLGGAGEGFGRFAGGSSSNSSGSIFASSGKSSTAFERDLDVDPTPLG